MAQSSVHPWIRPSSGLALQAVALGHAVVGTIAYRDVLRSFLDDGPVGSVPDRGDRATVFWFMWAGPLLWVTGRLLRSAEAAGDEAALRSAGTALTGVALVGIVAMPRSGFWAVAAAGLGARRAAARPRTVRPVSLAP